VLDRVVVLSLARCTARREALFSRLAAIDWPLPAPEVYPAIDGRRLGFHVHNGPGFYGHIATRRRLYEDLMLEAVPSVLVLEDDVVFRRGFGRLFCEAFAELPADWNVFYLGGEPWPAGDYTTYSPHLVTTAGSGGPYAVAMRLDYIRSLYGTMIATVSGNYNHMVRMHGERHKPRAFMARPSLVGHAAGASTTLPSVTYTSTLWGFP